MANKSGRMNFENVLRMVREEPEKVFAKHARMLSDLSPERAGQLRSVLAGIPAEKRAEFFRKMDEAGMVSFEYNFTSIAEIGIEDEDGDVRAASISALGFDDSKKNGAKILEAARNDPYEKAQLAAIGILGQYMFEAEIDNRIPVSKKALHEVLTDLIESKNGAVRRAAVVSFAISETERIREIISGYLAGNDREELISALRAIRVSMGEGWEKSVLELIQHNDEQIAAEAIGAAGSLQMREALPVLYRILSRFDRVPPELLLSALNAVAEIGDEGSLDVLETLGEAAVDMDDEITEGIDDAIDMLNMTIEMGGGFEDLEPKRKMPKKSRVMLEDAIEKAKDRCLMALEEKIPHDLEDDEAMEIESDEDDECGCGEHHHHEHHHHHHEHKNPLEGLDLSRFRILDDLEAYEKNADLDEDEEELWAAFEEMDPEDLDADSLQDFISKLESKKKRKAD